jgi:hypothetical protein
MKAVIESTGPNQLNLADGRPAERCLRNHRDSSLVVGPEPKNAKAHCERGYWHSGGLDCSTRVLLYFLMITLGLAGAFWQGCKTANISALARNNGKSAAERSVTYSKPM